MAMLRIEVTAGRPKDLATAVVDGQRYEARSSAGAIFALCRQLVAAGVPDQPWESINSAAPGVISMRGRSIHEAARLTVSEREGDGLRLERWAAYPGAGPGE